VTRDWWIVAGLIWLAVGFVVLLPVCALLRASRERMEDPWPE
jgi:hypothetical protein